MTMTASAEHAKERAVDSLEQIYAVVIALAITQAIESLLKDPVSGSIVAWHEVKVGLPPLVALLFTVVPFWHGMNRHLDRCYVREGELVKQGLLLDFTTFLLEAGLLFATAWSLRSGLTSFVCLGLLLFVDTVWALISHWIHFSDQKSHALRWARVNAVFIVGGVLIATLGLPQQAVVLMALAIARTLADYRICSDFYFPSR